MANKVKLLLIIISSIFVFSSCIRMLYPSIDRFDAKYSFQKDDIKLELYAIDTLVRNNRAFFLLTVRNNTNYSISFQKVSGIFIYSTWSCLDPWQPVIFYENGAQYGLIEVSVGDYLLPIEEIARSVYISCQPHDKSEMLIGIDFSNLRSYERGKKSNKFGKFYVHFEYYDCLEMNENYVAGRAITNTVAVQYLEEYNKEDFKLDSLKK